MKQITFTVGGMSCMGCVSSVKNLLAGVPGVGKVEVDLASGQVQAEYDPEKAQPADLRQAIVDGGYQVPA